MLCTDTVPTAKHCQSKKTKKQKPTFNPPSHPFSLTFFNLLASVLISYHHPRHLRPLLLSSSSLLSVSPPASVSQSLPHPSALPPSASGLASDGCRSVRLLPPARSGSVPAQRSSTCFQRSHWESGKKSTRDWLNIDSYIATCCLMRLRRQALTGEGISSTAVWGTTSDTLSSVCPPIHCPLGCSEWSWHSLFYHPMYQRGCS